MVASDTPKRSAQAEREVRRDTPLRRARSCYGHLAGVEGVSLMEGLLERGWIEDWSDDFHAPVRLTTDGIDAMTRMGIDVDGLGDKKRKFAFACLDWSERRFHLGGALGVEVLRSLENGGYAKRLPDTRRIDRLKPVGEWLKEGAPGF